MATTNPTDFPMNNSERKTPTFGQFIRMKRVPRRRRKVKPGMKKLINKFEDQLTQGQQVQGTVLVPPSAPSYPEDGSDCESWGSDFSEGENTEVSSWEAQEEMENDINDMLEAEMERKRKLQNSCQLSSNETQALTSRSDAPLRPERPDVSVDRNAPPLPPRNPEVASGASHMNRNRRNRALAADSSPRRNISHTSVNSPLGSADKTPENPQLPRTAAMSVPSISNIGSAAGITSVLPTRSESLQATPQEPSPTFPPDVTSFPSTSNFLRLSPGKSIPAGNASPVPGRNVNSNADREAIPPPSGTQVGKPQRVKLSQPEIRDAASSQYEGSKGKTVPPPLPLRPPPVRPSLNQPTVKSPASKSIPTASKSIPTHLGTPVSASNEKNNASVLSSHPGQPLPNSAATLHITKDASSSPAILEENALQNPPSSESSKPISSASSKPISSAAADNIFAHDIIRLPEKPEVKRRSIAIGIPKIIKELDAAVLKQVFPKKRDKSSSTVEMEHSLEQTRSCSFSENSAKAENTANNLSDDYLNPKEVLTEAMNEKPKNDQELLAANDDVFRQPWYHPVTWPQAQLQLVKMAQDGAFLVRPSSKVSEGVPFTLSVFFRGRVINCHISSTPGRKFALGNLKPNQKIFDTITELIRFYQSTPAELKISKEEPVAKVRLLITPPKDSDKIYADA